MRARIERDDEVWEARMDAHDPHPGVRAVVFMCVSNPQRAYHVVEVDAGEVPDGERLAFLGREALGTLFDHSDPMDYVHDSSADALHPGGHPLPGEETG